jgi:hypothetical protein
MSLPKELIDAVKGEKEATAAAVNDAKVSIVNNLNGLQAIASENELSSDNADVIKAIDKNTKAVSKIDTSSNNESSSVAGDDFSSVTQSIIHQGDIAEERLKMAEIRESLQEKLAKTQQSMSEQQVNATRESIELMKGDTLDSLESLKETRELGEKTVSALENIEKSQENLVRDLKSGFEKMRGEGIGGLVKMLLIGIPVFLAGVGAGILSMLSPILNKFAFISNILQKVASLFQPLIGMLKSGSGAIKGMFAGFKALQPAISVVSSMFGNFAGYAGSMFTFGKTVAKLIPGLGIIITVISGIIGGIKGAIKGFKSDGIVGMFREGIIGVFNALIGGLVKMVGSLIGGIFKLLGFEKIGEGIKSGFSDFIDGIVGMFRGLFNIIAGIFTLDFDKIKKGFAQVLDGIVNVIWGALKGVGGILLGIVAGIGKAIIGAIKMAFSALLSYLKFFYITLPVTLIKFIGGALKFMFIDLPIAAFKMLAGGLKLLLITLPLKMIGFATQILKSIFVDLPLAAFGAIFNGVKFLFTELPGLLINKVKSFFVSMVESIGNAFSGALNYVKLIGSASIAALKAAFPGGESPTEAFTRVMGGDGAGEKSEEDSSKNIEKEKELEAVAVEAPQAVPQESLVPIKKSAPKVESVEEFEARMSAGFFSEGSVYADSRSSNSLVTNDAMTVSGVTNVPAASGADGAANVEELSTSQNIASIENSMTSIISGPAALLKAVEVNVEVLLSGMIEGIGGLVKDIFGFIGRLGNAGVAAIKAIVPGGDSPAEAFMKVLTGEGKPKESSKASMLKKSKENETIADSKLSSFENDESKAYSSENANEFSDIKVRKYESAEDQRQYEILKNEAMISKSEVMSNEASMNTSLSDATREKSRTSFSDKAMNTSLSDATQEKSGTSFLDKAKGFGKKAIKTGFKYSMPGLGLKALKALKDNPIGDVISGGFKKLFGIDSEETNTSSIKSSEIDRKNSVHRSDSFMPKLGTQNTGLAGIKEYSEASTKLENAERNIKEFESTAGSFKMVEVEDDFSSYTKKVYDDKEQQEKFVKLREEKWDAHRGKRKSRSDVVGDESGAELYFSLEHLDSTTLPGMTVDEDGGKSFSGNGFHITQSIDKFLEQKAQQFIAQKASLEKVPSNTGINLVAGQRENSQLNAENNQSSSGAAIIAPSNTVDNSNKSVSNVTIAAPAHIDKTQMAFGATALAW